MLFAPVPDGVPTVADAALGQRSKLGGSPTWIQFDETPQCPRCSHAMTFLAQIDSIEHDEPSNPHRVNCLSPDQQ